VQGGGNGEGAATREESVMKCLGTRGGPCLNECLIVNAVAGLAVGLVLVDRRSRVVWINRTAEKLLGLQASECYGRPLRSLLKNPRLLAFWHDAAHQDENAYAELTVTWPRKMELKVNATRCLDNGGRETGRALLVCDVTEERAVQVKFSQAVAARLLSLTADQTTSNPARSLTQQELRMLRLVGQGLGNEDIARSTHISSSTVRSHLKSLYRKLGVSSKALAVAKALQERITVSKS
jgi:PAS domain S-box-containing protein